MSSVDIAQPAAGDPVAQVERWLPTRAGILNVWRYYDEIFEFHHGRLLLRGRNGSGKSKALELLLPYLLDANTKPARLSTFGGSDRTMHWNLMGQGVDTATRVGYVWLEFQRGSDSALQGGPAAQWFTCGVRLQASRTTTRVTADYFTTTQRIGPGGLELLNEARQPATRVQLVERLADVGVVHPSAAEYRNEVRRSLFPGMDAERYDSLIQALLQLRRPKLSERLDPSVLSTLLSRSLPPIDSDEIAALAEGFERLDKQRENIEALGREVDAARSIAERSRVHARRVLRAAAVGLTQATATLDARTRAARDSAQAHDEALSEQVRLHDEQQHWQSQGARAQAEVAALAESQEYRAGRQLDELRSADEAAARVAAQALSAVTDSRAAASRAAEVSADAHARVTECQAALAAEQPRAGAAAASAGLAALWQRCLDAGDHPTGDTLADLVRPAINARLTQVEQVVVAVDRHDETLRRRADAESELEERRTRAARAQADVQQAEAGLDDELTTLCTQLATWAAGASLPGLDPDELVELAADETRDPERPISERVQLAADPVRRDLAELRRCLDNRADELRTRTRDVQAQLDQVRAAKDITPTRSRFSQARRDGDAGAPLWQLVGFRDDVTEDVRAATEAALEAAGLLDAWVCAPGAPPPVGHDIQLDPAGLLAVDGPSLAAVLQPEPGGVVPADVVAAILRGIAWNPAEPAPGGTAVAAGAVGRWQLGGLSGTWEKATSQHIGATARARARAALIAQLQAQLDQIDAALAALATELAQWEARDAQLRAALAALPDFAALRAAQARLRDQQRLLADRQADLVTAGNTLETRSAQAGIAGQALRDQAAEHRLPQTRAALGAVRAHVEDFRDAAAGLVRILDRLAELQRHAADAAAQQASTATMHATNEAALSRAREAAGAAHTRLVTLQEAVGATYEQVLTRMAQARAEHEHAGQQLQRLAGELLRAAGQVGQSAASTARDAQAAQDALAARDTALAHLNSLLAQSLASDAGVHPQWRDVTGTRATVEVARAINAEWASVVHEPRNITEAANRLGEVVHAHRDVLASRAILGMAAADIHQVLDITMNGVAVGAADLLETLRVEHEEALTTLTAEERDLFDRTLTGDTRRHLADRLRRARELVDTMNRRLAGIRTASGVAVRINWQVDPAAPVETRAARDLFLKDAALLPKADQDALHTFLRGRIDAARAGNMAATWEQQLAEVFDYTAWHRFQVEMQRGDGGWATLTSRLHGVLSGGEKAIALHLPLFAAVAAHYESVPAAPRFILLDEVFVGVDETNRGQVFRLLADLGLDLVLTSDHEWCTYAELDGIAIYQLISEGDEDPVTTAHFVWDGRAKVAADPVPDEDLTLDLLTVD